MLYIINSLKKLLSHDIYLYQGLKETIGQILILVSV